MSKPKRKEIAAFKKVYRKVPAKMKRLHRTFWGVKQPPTIKVASVKGVKRNKTFVSLGISPAFVLAQGPQNRPGKIRRIKKKGYLLTNGSGKKLWVYYPRGKKKYLKKKRFLGYVPQTEYYATPDLEKANSFKKRVHWIHKHTEGGGKWPKAYLLPNGMIEYAKGTYKVRKWLYK